MMVDISITLLSSETDLKAKAANIFVIQYINSKKVPRTGYCDGETHPSVKSVSEWQTVTENAKTMYEGLC
jgi:hypothetical protein